MEVRLLAHFKTALDEHLSSEGLPVSGMIDQQSPIFTNVLDSAIGFGNWFLEQEMAKPENKDVVIWFDVYWGDPAVVGMTWAHNPFAPHDDLYDQPDQFWRMWTEIAERRGKPRPSELHLLSDVKKQMSAYILQHTKKGQVNA